MKKRYIFSVSILVVLTMFIFLYVVQAQATVVNTWREFKAALEDTSIEKIKFGTDIKGGSQKIYVRSEKKEINFNGFNFTIGNSQIYHKKV